MFETRYTHVASDLEESVAFYESVFGRERIPTPALGEYIRWLACGDRQRRLVGSDAEPPVYVPPSGAVQLYVRDPGGNRVEVNAPDADAFGGSIVWSLIDRRRVARGRRGAGLSVRLILLAIST
ncbi:VOC family protein [Halobellus ruber]|uniref:VOC family protein n=1 Tax=Halobellus ruber TaxID=2761102 RepID=UPI001C8A9E61|nr:hypothetical protein [Halobellus ruber]